MDSIQTPHGTKLVPVPGGKQRMKFFLNGVEITTPVISLVACLETPQTDFQVVYGLGPSGYDDIAWREIGGGGVVDTLFTFIEGELYIGLLTQNRPYQSDQPIENVIRGYLDPAKTRLETAKAEAEEEGGVSLVAIEMAGDPTNPNNASTESWGGGITHYRYVPPKLLVSEADGFVFKPGVAKATDPIGDKILKCHFIHWKKAARLGDQMTLAGGFRLLADLADLKVAIILFTEYYE